MLLLPRRILLFFLGFALVAQSITFDKKIDYDKLEKVLVSFMSDISSCNVEYKKALPPKKKHFNFRIGLKKKRMIGTKTVMSGNKKRKKA